ncbi:MAG: heavy-metal-associated domain-containing protein [Cyclobacteriaceae bacterium]
MSSNNRRSFIVSIALLLLFAFQSASASIKWVEIGVNGLTCSLCTWSVEKRLSKLDFIESVSMNLENTEGKVFLKKDVSFDLSSIPKAIKEAGFSVRFVYLVMDLEKIEIDENNVFKLNDQSIRWLDFDRKKPQRETKLQLIDAGFLPKKDSQAWRKKIKSSNSSGIENLFHAISVN